MYEMQALLQQTEQVFPGCLTDTFLKTLVTKVNDKCAHEQLLLTLQCALLEDENSIGKLTKTSRNFLAKLKAHV